MAGWAITLAGLQGFALQEALGSAEAAGAAIYLKSTGSVPNFYASETRGYWEVMRRAGVPMAERNLKMKLRFPMWYRDKDNDGFYPE